jgi:hypothetical protein
MPYTQWNIYTDVIHTTDQVICFFVCMRSGYMFPCVYDISCVWYQVICLPVCMTSVVYDIRLYVSFMTSCYMFPCVYDIRLFVSFMTSGYMFPCVDDIRLYVSIMTSGFMFPCVYDIRIYVPLRVDIIHTMKHITWCHKGNI